MRWRDLCATLLLLLSTPWTSDHAGLAGYVDSHAATVAPAAGALLLPRPRYGVAAAMTTSRRLELRELVKDTWYHAFNSYMKHAFPADELRPLTCDGLSRDGSLDEHEINDVMGGYALTLIDALDSLVVFGDRAGFETAVRQVIQIVTFDLDVRIQVFEVTIRVLGGLLSAHIYASSPKHGFRIEWYTDELLHLAHDLGKRLLPAFQHSLTGLPWARVNLRTGLGRSENMETCSAAAGSLLLEFGTLSRLTGDPVFEQVARKALFQLWNRRSHLGLLGNTINVQTGHWISTRSTTGAGIDSFFEYIAKAYILFGDDEYYRIWTEAYGAVMKWLRSNDGFWYRSVNMDTGELTSVNVDSLSAFFPGLQVLMGDVESAIKSHSVYAMLWERFSGSPEVFSTQSRRPEALAWPLRPELVESTLSLYRATKDDTYLHFGERVIIDIVNRTKVPCGLAALDNVVAGTQQNRMHSFSIAETLPYLYLLFDEHNPINNDVSNGVFTTEGHYITLDKEYLHSPPKSRRGEAQTCPRYHPRLRGNASLSLHTMQQGVAYRSDMEYARSLVGLSLDPVRALSTGLWDRNGYCEMPSVEDYVLTLLFSPDGQEDASPAASKVKPLTDGRNGYLIRSIQNLRLQITRRMDDKGGYDITRIGPYRVPSSATVYIADPAVLLVLHPTALARGPSGATGLLGQVTLRFSSDSGDVFLHPATKASFGPDMAAGNAFATASRIFRLPASNEHGCLPFELPPFAGSHGQRSLKVVVAVERGGCPFLEKMRNAAAAGAAAVIVLHDEEDPLIPSGNAGQLAAMKKRIPLVLLPRSGAALLHEQFDSSTHVEVDLIKPPDWSALGEADQDLASTPVVMNGYWLVNCKLTRP